MKLNVKKMLLQINQLWIWNKKVVLNNSFRCRQTFKLSFRCGQTSSQNWVETGSSLEQLQVSTALWQWLVVLFFEGGQW